MYLAFICYCGVARSTGFAIQVVVLVDFLSYRLIKVGHVLMYGYVRFK